MMRVWKIAFWTLFVAIGSFLIIDGKVPSQHWLEHLLFGGVAGIFLGYLFSRRAKAEQAATPKS